MSPHVIFKNPRPQTSPRSRTHMVPPMTIEDYERRTNKGRFYLDSRRFGLIQREVDYHTVTNSSCARHLMASGGCNEHWSHWGGRVVVWDEPDEPLDIPFVRCSEECPYVAGVVRVFRYLRFELVASPISGLYHCAPTYPYISLALVNKLLFWGPNFDFE